MTPSSVVFGDLVRAGSGSRRLVDSGEDLFGAEDLRPRLVHPHQRAEPVVRRRQPVRSPAIVGCVPLDVDRHGLVVVGSESWSPISDRLAVSRVANEVEVGGVVHRQ